MLKLLVSKGVPFIPQSPCGPQRQCRPWRSGTARSDHRSRCELEPVVVHPGAMLLQPLPPGGGILPGHSFGGSRRGVRSKHRLKSYRTENVWLLHCYPIRRLMNVAGEVGDRVGVDASRFEVSFPIKGQLSFHALGNSACCWEDTIDRHDVGSNKRRQRQCADSVPNLKGPPGQLMISVRVPRFCTGC